MQMKECGYFHMKLYKTIDDLIWPGLQLLSPEWEASRRETDVLREYLRSRANRTGNTSALLGEEEGEEGPQWALAHLGSCSNQCTHPRARADLEERVSTYFQFETSQKSPQSCAVVQGRAAKTECGRERVSWWSFSLSGSAACLELRESSIDALEELGGTPWPFPPSSFTHSLLLYLFYQVPLSNSWAFPFTWILSKADNPGKGGPVSPTENQKISRYLHLEGAADKEQADPGGE